MVMTIKTRTLAHNLTMGTQTYLSSSRATRMESIETSVLVAGKINRSASKVRAKGVPTVLSTIGGAMPIDKVSVQCPLCSVYLTRV